MRIITHTRTRKELLLNDEKAECFFRSVKLALELNEHRQRFLVVKHCYYELEKGLLIAALWHQFGYDDFFYMSNSTAELEAKILGLLSAIRGYHDQRARLYRYCLDQSLEVAGEAIFHKKFDESLEYRFVEKLRNVVQHRDSSIATIVFHSMRKDKDNNRFASVMDLYIKTEAVSQYRDTFCAVAREVESLDRPHLNLHHYLKIYGDILADAHAKHTSLFAAEASCCLAVIDWVFGQLVVEGRDLEVLEMPKDSWIHPDCPYVSNGILELIETATSDVGFPRQFAAGYVSNEITTKRTSH